MAQTSATQQKKAPTSPLSKTDQVCRQHHRELAIAQRDVGIFLQSNGFDPANVQSQRGRWLVTYPLHEAVKQNNAYITAKLLMFGAVLEARDTWGYTAKQYAKGRTSHQQVEEVLDHHAKYCMLPGRSSSSVKAEGPRWHKSQACAPPRGFEQFFADLELRDPLVQVPSQEGAWLLIRGPKNLRHAARSTSTGGFARKGLIHL
ncbi:unnamed protein product [Durusdinium trenchii]|uniref:Uncharacterized protein n=2 Tax=Durusdinium trenchii TaxID=1381693 RepID=A0ABP0LZ89_9DINO